jgi:hypothetical protein
MALSSGKLRKYVRDKNGRFASTSSGGSTSAKTKRSDFMSGDAAILRKSSKAYPVANKKGVDSLER